MWGSPFLWMRGASLVVAAAVLGACASDNEPAAEVIASCTDWAQSHVDTCGVDFMGAFNSCNDRRSNFEPMGCGAELAAVIHCETGAAKDCATGESLGCPSSDTYGVCVSAFTRRTSCTRARTNDDQCPTGHFFFNCLGALPPSCIRLDAGGFVPEACCPSFGDGTQHFTDP